MKGGTKVANFVRGGTLSETAGHSGALLSIGVRQVKGKEKKAYE